MSSCFKRNGKVVRFWFLKFYRLSSARDSLHFNCYRRKCPAQRKLMSVSVKKKQVNKRKQKKHVHCKFALIMTLELSLFLLKSQVWLEFKTVRHEVHPDLEIAQLSRLNTIFYWSSNWFVKKYISKKCEPLTVLFLYLFWYATQK